MPRGLSVKHRLAGHPFEAEALLNLSIEIADALLTATEEELLTSPGSTVGTVANMSQLN